MSKEDKIREILAQMSHAHPAEILQEVEKSIGAPVNEETRLCACGYRVNKSSLPVVDTGVVRAVNNVCLKCTEDAKQVAHLCCTNCKEVFNHSEPFQEKTGFSYEAGKYYHTMECPHCSSAEGGLVIEKILYYKKNGIPYEDGIQKKIVK
jgi:hypothetical protein